MTAGSSALAAGEADAGNARLQLFVFVASCLLNQVALASKRYVSQVLAVSRQLPDTPY